jgi:hypothetical protein
MLVVEQNATRVLQLADRGYLLRTGNIIASGTGAELAADTHLFDSFIGIEASRSADVTKLLQTIVDGLGVGSTYALLALGISLIFGVMHLVNFAHGELITVGAYASYFFFLHGGSWWWMPVVIIGSAMLASVATELVAFRWVRNASPFTCCSPRSPRATVARPVADLRVAEAASRSRSRRGCSTSSRSRTSASR